MLGARGQPCGDVGGNGLEGQSVRRPVRDQPGEVRLQLRLTGEIEGRIVFDLDSATATRLTSQFAGTDLPEADALVPETVCELANQITGNAITSLNDQGFRFKVHPPALQVSDVPQSSEDTEAVVISLDTASGSVFMNIALRYTPRLEFAAAGR